MLWWTKVHGLKRPSTTSRPTVLLCHKKQTIDKAIPQIPVPDLDPHLNPEYNFDTFIEGYSNKLSRSVAEAVALNPAKDHIQIRCFCNGASGVGKNSPCQCHRYKNQRIISGETRNCTYLRIYSKYNTPTLYVTIRPTISSTSTRL